jgi:GDP-mannose 6-dehydrogenase
MQIAIFGLGYVGCVSAACLANDGHQVIGVDINPDKVATIGAGKSPIIEPGLDDLIASAVASGHLRASQESAAAVATSDVSIICVGTPSNGNGSLKLDYVTRVCAEIGRALAQKSDYHSIIVRSTVLPSTVREVLIPILEEHSGKRAGVDFGVCMSPEFLREGSAITDYYNPSLIVIGQLDARSGTSARHVFEAVDAEVVQVSLDTAEMVKYANNAFHALKIAFANEIGNLAKASGIDGREVMAILCRDHRLNISPAYLRPGFAFGGSCLPKDVRALLYRAKEQDQEPPLLRAILPSNEAQIRRGIEMVEAIGLNKVALLGLSFKAGTDDLRESPQIALIETLIGRGYQVRVFDEKVQLRNLMGANKTYIEQEIPHIASLMAPTLDEVVAWADVIVVGNGNPSFYTVPQRVKKGQYLVDLVGIDSVRGEANHGLGELNGNYHGICW